MTYLEQKAGKKQSEFEMLLSSNLSMDDIESDNYPLAKIFDQKVNHAVNDVVSTILTQNYNKDPQVTLQNISSKIPSTILVKYARAGKNYVSIEHTMGNLGNLFFSGIMEKAMQDRPENHHTVAQQNKICFIFRQ
ncbi:hypothetical protein [Candidatus Nitrosotenuis cloacae]|uniref:Uncharacterized protein n=1 Tax=Candidatus Nitrosotenuis cloacae TaxID=1603555 RepID=A0A3G1B030_9ARCH|nr:hypothetical protein [Candidatus Nitrosotenuis cloacae]AJZ75097.1 hypothetical protein SU86_000355 [Candidatus Nitrosotenuis cloacae]